MWSSGIYFVVHQLGMLGARAQISTDHLSCFYRMNGSTFSCCFTSVSVSTDTWVASLVNGGGQLLG